MKKLLLSVAVIATSFMSFAQVGIGTTTPKGALDVVSDNSGIILPRVANTSAVTTPVNGMIIYDISSNCAKIFENNVWSDCLSTGGSTTATVTNDCTEKGFEGTYREGVAFTADNTFSATVTNNSFSPATIAFATGDVVLSGAGRNGASITAVTPASATLIAGASQLVTYTLTGTPAVGDLTVTWTNRSLNCTSTITVAPNAAPVASNVNYTGTLSTGQTLTSSFDYTDAENDAQGTATYQWYTATDSAGANQAAISGAKSNTYILTGADVGKFIAVGVTPVATAGTSPGVEVISDYQGPSLANVAPVASNVNYTGTLSTGQTLTSSFDYTDAENDAQGTATYQWYTATDSAGANQAAISGAKSNTYILTGADVGKFIAVGVTPVATAGTSPGVEVISDYQGPSLANAAPVASSVTFSGTLQTFQLLTGSFSYSDTEGDAAGTATYQWFTADDAAGNSNVVAIESATTITYTTQGEDANKYIALQVTPVATAGTSPGVAVTSPYQGPIIAGDATFSLPIDINVASFDDDSGAGNDIQGVIDNDANAITFTVPYTAGFGSYSSYTSGLIPVEGQNNEMNNLTATYPAGTFDDSGNLTVTITVNDPISFNVKQQLAGSSDLIASFPLTVNGNAKGNLTLTALGGIPDRAFGDGVHDFIYLTVVSNGKVWLNNDLGANYSNVNNDAFSPTQQANASTDFNAYGSFFQWGRGADGHELITYTSSGGTAVNDAVVTDGINRSTTPEEPNSDKFLKGSSNWYTGSDRDNLWKTNGTGVNNPCPIGFRLPIEAEWQAELASWPANPTREDAYNSVLKLPVAGYRLKSSGALSRVGSFGYYWSSKTGTNARYLFFKSNFAGMRANDRAFGFSVRCIKD